MLRPEGDRGVWRGLARRKRHRCGLQNIPAPRSTKRAAYRVPLRARMGVREGVTIRPWWNAIFGSMRPLRKARSKPLTGVALSTVLEP